MAFVSPRAFGHLPPSAIDTCVRTTYLYCASSVRGCRLYVSGASAWRVASTVRLLSAESPRMPLYCASYVHHSVLHGELQLLAYGFTVSGRREVYFIRRRCGLWSVGSGVQVHIRSTCCMSVHLFLSAERCRSPSHRR